MKKGKIIIYFTLVISISLFIGSFLGYNLTKDNEVNIIVPEKNIPTIITVEATECKTKNYIELKDYNVYTYCLDHLTLFENNNLVELKNYVPDKPEFITELISNLELETELDDGGTKIYKDKTDYTNAGLTLIKCNTLDGNKDIYIGPKDMEYQESFARILIHL